MASIKKRRGSYCVVYNYVNEFGETKQKWETYHSHKDAVARKAEVEHQQTRNTFIAPSTKTVSELMEDFVALYGQRIWSVSTYGTNCAIIENYINPIIGNIPLQAMTTKEADKYIQTLERTHPVSKGGRPAKTTYLTPSSIEKIIKLLRCAFRKAVRWEMISKNPFDGCSMPKVEPNKRAIWTSDMIKTALDACTDTKLYLAMNLAFACSMRLGEILGLTWDNVHISEDEIASGDAYVFVDKELLRAKRHAIDALNSKDIILLFPTLSQSASTRLMLKKPKTQSSIRKIWLPPTVACILREWKKHQDDLKEFFGDEYTDYNLVISQPNGRPCENRLIETAFNRLKEQIGLPNVVFHSLRHSSTTYKLKLNRGDLKATQGDTGHAQIDMITDVYAHILDEDRKLNAQKFETAFYSNPDLRSVRADTQESSGVDLAALVAQLQSNPELAQTLAAIINGSQSKKES